jgi:hypothetical protein
MAAGIADAGGMMATDPRRLKGNFAAENRLLFGLTSPRVAPARGCQCPIAGRSSRPSRPRLSACPLRFAILATLAPIARLTGHWQPLASPQ